MGSRSVARSLYSRVRRNRLKSQGKCTDCSAPKPIDSKYTRCSRCHERHSKARMKFRQQRLNKGLCIDCNMPNADNYQLCDNCRAKKLLNRHAIKRDRNDKGLCVDCGKESQQEDTLRCDNCLNKKNADRGTARHLMKDEVFNAYGGYVCNCCGETEPRFLEIDHVHNNGHEMRKIHGTGSHMYSWLKANNYPNNFQILCSNCNRGKYRNGGTCPHQAA